MAGHATAMSTGDDPHAPELSVVMPVYNEQELVEEVVRDWTAELCRLDIDYQFAIYDDGSRDDTPAVLARLASENPRVQVLRHENLGHGPTVLRGYREARGRWVLQIDGDGEVGVEALGRLWAARSGHDLVIGNRVERRQPSSRRLVSAVARLGNRVLFGKGIHDVNAPCRLVRRTVLQEMVRGLPRDMFAPNVAISGLAVRQGLRIGEVPVRWSRRRGRSTLDGLAIVRPALRAMRELLAVASRRCPRDSS